ncbi:hypothetical protein [Myroides sp. LoEW2-1]|uniref:hypothetical protein n=1 Tax=Myroides sp. LoEW2-1 TaxID=2683192 RepID=UPI001325DE27|nr:hypothetical protein [Myroides sp. LoEW2-1]MVX36323.1 hypothetical protein [Myroides sp. LoEW2-1]
MITLGFREKEKGWTSFFSYNPDAFLRSGNDFFTINRKGNLYFHNDIENPVTNTFYGEKYPSKISTVFNDIHSEDKIFKTFSIEGSHPWDIEMKTNLTKTSLVKEEFSKRESRFFTHLRGNEDTDDLHGRTQGIGVCTDNTEDTLYFDLVDSFTNIGDEVFILDNEKEYSLGIVKSKGNNYVTIDKRIDRFCKGYFFFSVKDSRVEGGDIRGYYAEVEMENNNDEQLELFAINSNIIKSYV